MATELRSWRSGLIVGGGAPFSPVGFRWPIRRSLDIAAPAHEIWAVISEPGYLENCHPFCAENRVLAWPGPESRDELHYRSGWIYGRHFTAWYEGTGYDLEIGGRGEPRSFVTWRIEPIDDQSATLTIAIYPHVLQRVPLLARWLPHLAFVRPLLRRYLSSVLRGVEWYVTRGEPVRPNQFGRHPWFSEKRTPR